MKILFCDDEKNVLKFYREEITYSIPEIEYFEAYNGLDALNICKKEHIDYVFTDNRMPKMEGPELAKTLKELPQPPKGVFMITGYNGEFDPEESKELGIDSIIYKPIDNDWLIDFIKSL